LEISAYGTSDTCCSSLSFSPISGSVEDIKHVTGEVCFIQVHFFQFFSLFRQHTVMDFMNAIVSTTKGTGSVIPPITCKPDATLGSLIHALSSRSGHRIHVVNQSEEVVGVITLRDVISCFVYEPPNHFDSYFSFSTKEMLDEWWFCQKHLQLQEMKLSKM